jgi:glycerol-3-phosphate dehydrogenase (NAD(P)+)
LGARDPALVADMRARGANAVYLPDIRFPSTLSVTDDLRAALAGTELIVSAVPSHGTRDILKRAAPHVHRGSTIVSATKGLE